MNSVKNRDLIINIISITVIISAIALFFYKNNKKEIVLPAKADAPILVVPKYQVKQMVKQDQAPTYDYKNLLVLMEKCRILKQEFNLDYSLFISNKINLKNLTRTLKELKLEKSYFKQYIKQSKNYHRRKMPSRKRNSMRYHFRVLEDRIDEIKKLIEKFNLNIKLKIDEIDKQT